VSYQKKAAVYTHSKLNQHLKSNFHSRREQFLRAFNFDKDDKSKCRCSRCGDGSNEMHGPGAFIAHMEDYHREIMEF
jgi:hypothetical protein